MSEIKVSKLSLDLGDDMVDPGVFDYAPFALKYKQAARFLPNLDSGNHNTGNVMYHENAIVSQNTISTYWEQKKLWANKPAHVLVAIKIHFHH
eukprot:3469654-Ditylum_brightwellii.AAC.2